MFLLLADGKKLARIEVELASLGVDCNLEGDSFMHVHEGGHAVYEAPALLLSRPAYVLIRKGWVVFPLCFLRETVRRPCIHTTQSTFSCIVSSLRTCSLI